MWKRPGKLPGRFICVDPILVIIQALREMRASVAIHQLQQT